MRFPGTVAVVFDLEWTSWPGFLQSGFSMPGKHCEIVQMGAVKLDAHAGFQEIGSFEALVKPVLHPELSEYFVALTGITQAEVDREGLPFAEALARFVAFAEGEADVLGSFGGDEHFIAQNCGFHDIVVPAVFRRAVNLRPLFSAYLGIPDSETVSSEMPGRFGLVPEGRAHGGLADSRRIAQALRHLSARGEIEIVQPA